MINEMWRGVFVLSVLAQCCLAQEAWGVAKVVSLEYPPIAAQARIEGTVEVQCDLDQNGVVISAHARGHELLGVAARENVLRWRFRRNGEDTKSGRRVAVVTYTFRLAGICMKQHCPSSFTFEAPGFVTVEAKAPHWQP